MHRSKLWATLAALIVTGGLLSSCSGSDGGSGTQIEFFQFKSEAVATFDKLIAEFEKEHPNIDIVQNNVPSADAALRTRLVKNDVPELMTLNGNGGTYGDLAKAGIFRDWSGDPVIETTTEASRKILTDLGTSAPGAINGIPFANNADGILYNVDLYKQLGLSVPTTWDQLIDNAEKIKAAGLVPFYLTWKEAWTTQPPFNPLAQNISPEGFWPERKANETSFSEAWPDVAQQLLELKEYGPDDPFRFDYNTGNRAMADGEAVMYPQGIWAISSIRGINKDINLSTFPFPSTNDAAKNQLVSGVDILITMPAEEVAHEEQVLTFIRWLMEPEHSKQYADEQAAFSDVKGIEQTDPALAPLNDIFQAGDIVGFADHHIPSSIPLANMLQAYLIDGNWQGFLSDLDDQYDTIQKRRGDNA